MFDFELAPPPPRISLRQSVVVLPPDPAFPFEERRSALRAVLGAVVAVNGVTIAVPFADAADARELRGALPPGIELHVADPAAVASAGLLAWALKEQAARDFARTVAVAGDAVGLAARTVATALSVLASADLAAAASSDGRLYLLGLRDHQILDRLSSLGLAAGFAAARADDVRQEAARLGRTIRWLEPRDRLLPPPSLIAAPQSSPEPLHD